MLLRDVAFVQDAWSSASDGSIPGEPSSAVEVSKPQTCAPLLDVDEQETKVEVAGWLKKITGNGNGSTIARSLDAICRTSMNKVIERMLWKNRYFVLGKEELRYWASEDMKSLAGDSPLGAFPLNALDEVTMQDRDVLLHFMRNSTERVRSRPLEWVRLRASSRNEADRWMVAVRKAAAKLDRNLPPDWDLFKMLGPSLGPMRLTAKVCISQQAVTMMQHMINHAFVWKRTRDRERRIEVPLWLEVESVLSVQNASVWTDYCKARKQIQEKAKTGFNVKPLSPPVRTTTCEIAKKAFGSLDESINETWLFHGTSFYGVHGIADTDFQLSHAGTHRGCLYGRAIYLAECSSKADEYSDESSDGLCHMLLCRALLGRILVDSEVHPDPEHLINKVKSGYDSLCGDRWLAVGSFREFVLFDPVQVYPSYIVSYRRRSLSRLLQALETAAEYTDVRSSLWLIPEAVRIEQEHPDKILKQEIRKRLVTGLTGATADELKNTELGSSGAVAWVIQCLEHPSEDMRGSAVLAIGRLGKHIHLAPPALVEWLNQVRGSLRLAADPNQEERAPTVKAPKKKESSPTPEVPELLVYLTDASDSKRQYAAATLGRLGEQAASAAPALAGCLSDSNETIRFTAAVALGQLGKHSAPVASDLANALGDPSRTVRHATAISLGQLGEHAASFALALGQRLSDPDEVVRNSAKTAFDKLGDNASTLVLALGEHLTDPNESVRCAAATALGHIRKHIALVAPALARCLADPSSQVRPVASNALRQLGRNAASAMQVLSNCIRDDRLVVRQEAAEILGRLFEDLEASGRLGEYAASAVPVLAAHLADERESVCCLAAALLKQLSSHASAVAPELAQCLGDDSAAVRDVAADTLIHFGALAAPAVPTIIGLAESANPIVRQQCSALLARLVAHEPVRRVLTRYFQDPRTEVRNTVATALQRAPENGSGMAPPSAPKVYDIASLARLAGCLRTPKHGTARVPRLGEFPQGGEQERRPQPNASRSRMASPKTGHALEATVCGVNSTDTLLDSARSVLILDQAPSKCRAGQPDVRTSATLPGQAVPPSRMPSGSDVDAAVPGPHFARAGGAVQDRPSPTHVPTLPSHAPGDGDHTNIYEPHEEWC